MAPNFDHHNCCTHSQRRRTDGGGIEANWTHTHPIQGLDVHSQTLHFQLDSAPIRPAHPFSRGSCMEHKSRAGTCTSHKRLFWGCVLGLFQMLRKGSTSPGGRCCNPDGLPCIHCEPGLWSLCRTKVHKCAFRHVESNPCGGNSGLIAGCGFAVHILKAFLQMDASKWSCQIRTYVDDCLLYTSPSPRD